MAAKRYGLIMLVKKDPSARPTIPIELPLALHLAGKISEEYANGAHTARC